MRHATYDQHMGTPFDPEQDPAAEAILEEPDPARRLLLEAQAVEQTDNGPQPGDPPYPQDVAP